MKLAIVEADLERDRQTVSSVLNRNREYEVDGRRFDWLYLDNPAGRARVWLLRDEEVGQVVGASAALPRKVWLRGSQIVCQVMSDFSIDGKYRSIGPALKLNRRTLQPVLEGQLPFAYDFPTEAMSATHRFMKVSPIGKQLRLVQPLRFDAQLEKLLGRNLLSRAAGQLGAAAVKGYARLQRLDRGYQMEDVQASSFGEDATALDAQIGPGFAACGVRNHHYLNWRYGKNPMRVYRAIRLARRGQLVGFAVYTRREEGRIAVYDLYALPEPEVQRNLLAALLGVAAASDADGIEVSLLETNPWIPLLKRRGYLQRPEFDSIYVFLPLQTDLDGLVNQAASWYMTKGDMDT